MPTQNPNWPLLQVLWSPTTNGTFDSALPIYTDITLRCLKQWLVQRGRQYELDEMQPGTFQTTLNNRDGAFNPVSAASPFAPGVLPERSIKVLAQWPPTANLLSGDLATAGEVTPIAPGSIPASMRVTSDVGATLTIAASASAFQGTQVFQAAVPANILTNFYIIRANYIPVQASTIATPATTYTWSTYVRCTTSGVNPQVSAEIEWLNATGTTVSATPGSTATLAGSTTAAWTRVTVTGKPPVGAVCGILAVAARGTTPTSAWTYQQDGLQFETAAAASTWTAPGTWYPIYTGNVERYPNVYDLSGTRGLANIQASDALGLLSQSLIAASLDGLIANPGGDNSQPGADFSYTLGDPALSTQFADSRGNMPLASIVNSKYGAGTITPGTPITPAGANGFVGGGTGATTTAFAVGSGYTPGSSTAGPCSMIALPANANGLVGPPATGGFTRMVAFKCTTPPTASSTAPEIVWRAFDTLKPGGTLFECTIQVTWIASVAAACPEAKLTDGTETMYFSNIATPIATNTWFLVFIGLSDDRMTAFYQVNGGSKIIAPFATPMTFPSQFFQDALGATVIQSSGTAGLFAFAGDIAYATQWPTELTNAQMVDLYSAWRTAYEGDSSDERAGRILSWGHYTGPRALDAGSSTSLGAATDVDGLDVVTSLQNVVETEGGWHFIARDGTYTFYARSRLLGSYTPVFSFGSNTAGGEIPFEDVQFDFDPTLIENDVTNTQVSTNQDFFSVNEASVTAFGARALNGSNQSTNQQEVQDQADWYAGVNGNPRIRVASLTLHPAANPSVLWPVCLSLELGQHVKVTQRPTGSAVGALDPIVMTGFIENIAITGQNTADATWILQISADVASGAGPAQPALEPWNLALLHTTLAAGATAGTNTITINALPTALTSTLDQNLPQGGPGFQLTIGSGLSTQETKTIQSISTTAIGYTTATITFTTNLANNHSAGEIVRETLGGASASTWQLLDAYSTLGSAMITY